MPEQADGAGDPGQVVGQSGFPQQRLRHAGTEPVGDRDDLVGGMQSARADQDRHLAAAVQHVCGAAQVLLIGDGSWISITDTGMDRAVLARRFLVRFVAEVVGNHQCRDPAFRFRHAHRAVDQVTDLRSGAGLLHEGAGHVLEHADQVDFLLIVATERRAGLLSGDRQHRHVIHPRVIHAR